MLIICLKKNEKDAEFEKWNQTCNFPLISRSPRSFMKTRSPSASRRRSDVKYYAVCIKRRKKNMSRKYTIKINKLNNIIPKGSLTLSLSSDFLDGSVEEEAIAKDLLGISGSKMYHTVFRTFQITIPSYFIVTEQKFFSFYLNTSFVFALLFVQFSSISFIIMLIHFCSFYLIRQYIQ